MVFIKVVQSSKNTAIVFGRTAGLPPDPGVFQLLEMELVTIPGDDDRGVALGLFATFLSSTNGDFKQRTSTEGTMIQMGQDMARSVSENGFREAFFCRELPGRLGFPVTTPPPMPPVCGTAGPLRIPARYRLPAALEIDLQQVERRNPNV